MVAHSMVAHSMVAHSVAHSMVAASLAAAAVVAVAFLTAAVAVARTFEENSGAAIYLCRTVCGQNPACNVPSTDDPLVSLSQ